MLKFHSAQTEWSRIDKGSLKSISKIGGKLLTDLDAFKMQTYHRTFLNR